MMHMRMKDKSLRKRRRNVRRSALGTFVDLDGAAQEHVTERHTSNGQRVATGRGEHRRGHVLDHRRTVVVAREITRLAVCGDGDDLVDAVTGGQRALDLRMIELVRQRRAVGAVDGHSALGSSRERERQEENNKP